MEDFENDILEDIEDDEDSMLLSEIDTILQGEGDNVTKSFSSTDDLLNSSLSDDDILGMLSSDDFLKSGPIAEEENTMQEISSILQTYDRTDESLSGENSTVSKIKYPFIYCNKITQLEFLHLQGMPVPKGQSIGYFKKTQDKLAKVADFPLEFEALMNIIKYEPSKEIKVKLSSNHEISFDEFIVSNLLRG